MEERREFCLAIVAMALVALILFALGSCVGTCRGDESCQMSVGKIVDGCTAFCVGDGVFLTAGHCINSDSVNIQIGRYVVGARVVKSPKCVDGTAVLYSKDAVGIARPMDVSRDKLTVGQEVFCYGFPGNRHGDLRILSGRVEGTTVCEHGVTVTITNIPVCGGMSGCPLVNSDCEVVGLLHSRIGDKSGWITQNDIVETLMSGDLTDVGIHVGRLNFGFGCDRDSCRRRPEVIQPRTPPNAPPLPPAAREDVRPGPVDAIAPDNTGGLDWAYVDFIAVASIDTPQFMRVLVGPGKRIIDEVSGGRAGLSVVAQRTNPAGYETVVNKSGCNPDPIAIVAMVSRLDIGLKGKLAEIIEKRVRPALHGLERIPIEIIFERAHKSDYDAIMDAVVSLETERYVGGEQPEGVSEEGVKGIVKNAISGAVDSKLKNLEDRISKKADNEEDPVHWLWGLLGAPLAALRRWLEDKTKNLA